jgi:aldose 1-epimerase
MRTVELQNEAGFRVELLDLGACIRSIAVPVHGRDTEVVLTYPNQSDYLRDKYYLGATLGRYAGRIADGQFSLQGRPIQLRTGNNIHCLHGGPEGFSRQFWSCVADSRSAQFNYQSVAGEQGFPGNLEVEVRYSLRGEYGLLIEYTARTDAETVINLSNHAYFNLNGFESDVTNHQVQINSDQIAESDVDGIPTGSLNALANSRFDFRQLVCLQDRIKGSAYGSDQGYDHTFALNNRNGGLSFAASAFSPLTGLQLNVHTTQPALQFYTGEFLGTPWLRRGGLCFEAQNFPDAPNLPAFPDARLKPGQIYSQKILYSFKTNHQPIAF